MADLKQLVEEIKGLSLMEASELVKMLEEELGVSAAAPVAAMAVAGMAAAAVEEVEEQTEFDVVLKEVGPKKIQVIKVVRQLTSLGLKEAKAVVDGAPSTILEQVSKEAAEEAKVKIEAEGAVAEVK
ncbi:MAG: 50S ribosomal protein L7/L12 [Anaerolineae bacterium]|jgi:large subunit ribosomal protein L7/L12|nr:50S ribosomal protein L7/L12 [Anaerolineae bacterium]